MSVEPFRILFVCMGNICRSPTGENIMRSVLTEAELSQRVICDSAGTIDFHTGKSPDPRMCAAGRAHGYEFRGSARQVVAADLAAHALILAMDRDNLDDLVALDRDGHYRDRIRLFASFCTSGPFPEEVPDPYYGGEEGFHTVIKMVEDGCQGILEHVRQEIGSTG